MPNISLTPDKPIPENPANTSGASLVIVSKALLANTTFILDEIWGVKMLRRLDLLFHEEGLRVLGLLAWRRVESGTYQYLYILKG